MFGIGLPEMILIMALALIVVGPDKLPEMARSIAKGVMELKKTVNSLKENFAEENPLDSVKPELEDAARSLKDHLVDPTSDGWKNLLEERQDNIVRDEDAVTGTARPEADAPTQADAADQPLQAETEGSEAADETGDDDAASPPSMGEAGEPHRSDEEDPPPTSAA